jgi:AraC family transcriptional regulator
MTSQVMKLFQHLEEGPYIPRIERLGAFIVAGYEVAERTPGRSSYIWNYFDRNEHKISRLSQKCVYYGVEILNGLSRLNAVPRYLAGMQINSTNELADDAAIEYIPENKYAVFEIAAVPEFLQKTIISIYQKWLPENHLEPTGDYDFELYDCEYIHNNPKAKFHLYIPIL